MCWLVLTVSLTQFRIRWKKITMEDWALGVSLGIFLVSQPIVNSTTPWRGDYGLCNNKASLVLSKQPSKQPGSLGALTPTTPHSPSSWQSLAVTSCLMAWLVCPDVCGVALWGKISPFFLTLLLVRIFFHTNRKEVRAEYR